MALLNKLYRNQILRKYNLSQMDFSYGEVKLKTRNVVLLSLIERNHFEFYVLFYTNESLKNYYMSIIK